MAESGQQVERSLLELLLTVLWSGGKKIQKQTNKKSIGERGETVVFPKQLGALRNYVECWMVQELGL